MPLRASHFVLFVYAPVEIALGQMTFNKGPPPLAYDAAVEKSALASLVTTSKGEGRVSALLLLLPTTQSKQFLKNISPALYLEVIAWFGFLWALCTFWQASRFSILVLRPILFS